MGLRGPGAKPKSAKVAVNDNLRQELPWEAEGLSRLERVIAFMEDMPVTQGKLAGTKMKLRDWQIEQFLEPIFTEDDEGKRRVRTAALSMGRKNGKTGISAALACCFLVGPEAEERGEIYFCAMDKAQAAKAWAECKAMLEGHAELSQRVN
ncbi:terminase large subunit, partial [Sinorhizobium meliloti]